MGIVLLNIIVEPQVFFIYKQGLTVDDVVGILTLQASPIL